MPGVFHRPGAHRHVPEAVAALAARRAGGSLLPAANAFDGGGQVVLAGLDVAPGGLQALVAGQGGDHLEPDAGVGQVLAPGVPQDVGGAFRQPGDAAVLGQGGLDAALESGPRWPCRTAGAFLEREDPGARSGRCGPRR